MENMKKNDAIPNPTKKRTYSIVTGFHGCKKTIITEKKHVIIDKMNIIFANCSPGLNPPSQDTSEDVKTVMK